MKKIIRSVMWEDPAEQNTAKGNLMKLDLSLFLSLGKAEREVLTFCSEFLVQHGEAPALWFVYDEFDTTKRPEAVAVIEEAQTEALYSGATFDAHVLKTIEDRAAESLTTLLKEAGKIATVGIVDAKGIKTVGVDAAISHLFTSARETPKVNTDKIPSNLKDAVPKLKDLYEARKANPHHTYGIMTGYGFIDGATGGVRKKQLYIHAGFGGHLKSTFMLNQIVNAAVDGGWNPLLFTTEMPQEEVQQMLISIHSANPKFNTTHPPLSAFRLLLGQLDAGEEAFKDLVADDLVNNQSHGIIRVVDSAEFSTWGTVAQRTVREHSILEVDELWVDYLTRLPPDLKYRAMSITEARNETIADAKRFAMGFDHGAGLAVATPLQVNREGYKRAKEREGKMDSTALAQFNAAEKEADIITYSWYDEDEKATSEPKLGMIKSRWGGISYKPLSLFIDSESRRIFDLSSGMGTASIPTADAGEVEI